MNIDGLNFVIAGAGIGGLAAALILRRKGARVTLVEQAPELTEIGAGLQISANGMTVLRALGVLEHGPASGLKSGGTILRDYRKGRLISEIPAPRAGPTYYFHRADLVDLLHTAAQRAGVELRLATRVSQASLQSDQVEVALNTDERLSADCVIGADGGRSSLRPVLNGPDEPQFSHQVAWRATLPWAHGQQISKAVLTMAPGRHVVTYPLRDHRLMNVVAVEERSDWREEGWMQAGDPEDLQARFADFGGAVGDIIRQVRHPNIWALFLRPVAETWQNGRLALLGDAAHPTLPFMAQGACLALEDAWMLGRSFDAQPGVAAALAAYERIRRPRARKVVATANANARNFHLRGPMRLAAQMALTVIGPRLVDKYDWIYGYDPTV